MLLRKSALAFLLAAGAVSFPLIAVAQENTVVEVPNANYRFIGEVNASSVNIRSGPADSYYATMRLNKGDKVIVVGQKFDWLKIIPPDGSFSYIAKVHVDKDADGKTGTVNSMDVLVKAGSQISPVKIQPQTKLDKGATVTIVGEAEEFYKIKPPADAFVYVLKKYVDPVRQATTTESVPAPRGQRIITGAAGEGVVDTSARPTTQDTSSELVKVTPTTAENLAKPTEVSSDSEAQFTKLESQFAAARTQPLADQPVEELLKGYQALVAQHDLSSASMRMAKFLVSFLTILQQQQADLVQAKKDQETFTARQAQSEAQRQQIQQRIKDAGIAVYTAIGQLDLSSIQKNGQPLMRLTNPADGRTLIYIKTENANIKLMIGKFVGVRGEISKDQQLSIDVIDQPTEIEMVDQAKVLKGISARIYPPSAVLKAQ